MIGKLFHIGLIKIRRLTFRLIPTNYLGVYTLLKPIFHSARKEDGEYSDDQLHYTHLESFNSYSVNTLNTNRTLTEAVYNDQTFIWDNAGIYVINKGRVFSEDGVCVTNRGKVLHHTVRCYGRPRSRHRVFHTLFKKKPRFQVGTVLVARGVSSRNFYHYIVDQVPRIILAQKHQLSFDKVLIDKGANYQKIILKQLGIQDSQCITLEDNEYLDAETIICPTYPYDGRISPLSTSYLAELGKRFPDNSNTSTYEKLFINRREKRILSDSKTVEFIKNSGFKEVFLEDYTLIDQIRLFRCAREIIAIHGAGLTNLVFVDRFQH